MNIMGTCLSIESFFAIPSTLLFLGVALFLTLKTRFIQVRAFPRLIELLSTGAKHHHPQKEKMINPFTAVLTAMATTIGMGNIVGPSIAVATGGPGALFWLVVYSLIGAAVKFTEVTFSMRLRKKLPDGTILGGPTQYLKDISPALGMWYGGITLFLFAGWSGLQANTLASIFFLEGVEKWMTGLGLAGIVFICLAGGIQRIGAIATKLVPVMFVLYVSFSLSILLSNPSALWHAFGLIFSHIFTPCAAVGGFLGASAFEAIRIGVHRSIYITESGLGTSSIAHAMADTDAPRDQAVLAMFSVAADTVLALLSGLLVIVTGGWTRGQLSNTLVYEVFRDYSPALGKWVLLVSVTLFVLTTVIGNSFNASQSFASITNNRGMVWYYLALCAIIFLGPLVYVPLAWKIMDLMLIMVAIPHLIGLVILSFKYRQLIK